MVIFGNNHLRNIEKYIYELNQIYSLIETQESIVESQIYSVIKKCIDEFNLTEHKFENKEVTMIQLKEALLNRNYTIDNLEKHYIPYFKSFYSAIIKHYIQFYLKNR